jgi:hypothetical protein
MGIKDEHVRKIAKKTNIDPRVVRLVADYPIKFAKEKMSNEEDWRPIRIRYFAVFLPKAAGHEYEKSDSVGKKRKGSIEDKELSAQE